MHVRLKQSAEITADQPIGRQWLPAGAECDIPDDHFDPALHEDLTPPTPAGAAPTT